MKRWRIFAAIVGLICMTSFRQPATITLKRAELLSDFPSGSSIEFYKERLYLIGDDATRMLVLNRDYKRVDSLQLFNIPGKRIAKNKKPDFEASALVTEDSNPYLLLLGSASAATRERALLVSVGKMLRKTNEVNSAQFFRRILRQGMKEVNIEGAVAINNKLLLANRGNLSNRRNHLILTSPDFWRQQKSAPVNISEIILKPGKNNFTGISGLAYISSKDLLVFTASTENTSSSVADGEIGDSYLGFIKNISGKLKSSKIQADALINLSTADKAFGKQKIESVCVEKVEDNKLILHLVSDNDNGQSRLFEIEAVVD